MKKEADAKRRIMMLIHIKIQEEADAKKEDHEDSDATTKADVEAAANIKRLEKKLMLQYEFNYRMHHYLPILPIL